MQGFASTPPPQTINESPIPDDGIDVFDVLISLLQAKRKIALCTAIFLLVGFGVSLFLKPIFTATAVIMPPEQQQSASSALMGQLGSLGSLGAASSLGLKNPADMYVGILQTRVIADDLIYHFYLFAAYRPKYYSVWAMLADA